MITAGIDIGTGSTKGILLEDNEKILVRSIHPTKGSPGKMATRILNEMIEKAKLSRDDIDYIASTGYGRYMMDERQIQISDLTTTGRGAKFVYDEYLPTLVLDIGTQSSRAIRIDERGKIVQFKMNERCAAGSGRFIERCSRYLVVPMDRISETAMKSTNPQKISSVCAVLSETEIINHVSQGIPVEDILMGVFMSIADRAGTLLKRVKLDAPVFLAGGLVHMPAMKKALDEVLDHEVISDPNAHFSAAIGAARLGFQRLQKIKNIN
ncbi:MAG: hypothetical protein D6732_26220 [Methanobacteriota archaeon]|nr:MAG: hypothetical protein D6732_26220 [Euryarchaeota archaeon]